MSRQAWTRDQLLKALSLYCQIPFGKMHSKNPAVIALADLIGRTPSAVALKLVNFASLDPDLQKRGVGGMGNTSVADREIWVEFYGKWDVLSEKLLADESQEAFERLLQQHKVERSITSRDTEVVREAKQRRGQAFFRSAVLAAYDEKCCITGISHTELLRASHIVPWSISEDLRLDPRNGMCMNALHDAAFDRGLITLTADYSLRVSRQLEDGMPSTLYAEFFANWADRPIALPERFGPSPDALEYHRTNIFHD